MTIHIPHALVVVAEIVVGVFVVGFAAFGVMALKALWGWSPIR